MKILTENGYPLGWEWISRVPLEDWNWLIEVFAVITDDTDVYNYATYEKEPDHDHYSVKSIDTKGLAEFMAEDQSIDSGIRTYGQYIVARMIHVNSEENFIENLQYIYIQSLNEDQLS